LYSSALRSCAPPQFPWHYKPNIKEMSRIYITNNNIILLIITNNGISNG
jgi:hypothetical protein